MPLRAVLLRRQLQVPTAGRILKTRLCEKSGTREARISATDAKLPPKNYAAIVNLRGAHRNTRKMKMI